MENENGNGDNLLEAVPVVVEPIHLPIAVVPVVVEPIHLPIAVVEPIHLPIAELLPVPVAAAVPPVAAHVYNCYNCRGRTFDSIRGIIKHNRDLHKAGRYNCGLCGTIFKFAADLSAHEEDVHQVHP